MSPRSDSFTMRATVTPDPPAISSRSLLPDGAASIRSRSSSRGKVGPSPPDAPLPPAMYLTMPLRVAPRKGTRGPDPVASPTVAAHADLGIAGLCRHHAPCPQDAVDQTIRERLARVEP